MKKKILSILLVCAMLVASLPVFTVASGAADIDWKNDKEIVINTAAQFIEFKEQLKEWNFTGQTVKLGDDIDFADYEIKEFNAGFRSHVAIDVKAGGFQGIFDGQYHTIKNLTVTFPGGNFGLFGGLNNGAASPGNYTGDPVVIKNFSIVDSSISLGNNSAIFYYQSRGADLTFENVYIGTDITFSNASAADGNSVFVNSVTGSVKFTYTVKNCVYDGTINTEHSLYGVFLCNSFKKSTPTVRIENCLIVNSTAAPYDTKGTKTYTEGAVGEMTATVTTPIDVVRYVDGNLVNAITGADVDMPAGFTARVGSYPVPTDALPLFTVNPDAPEKRYVKFMYNNALYDQVTITGESLTITEFPKIKIDNVVVDNVIWTDAFTKAIVDLPLTATDNTVLVAKIPGINDSSMLGVQCGAANNNKQSLRFIGGIYNLDGDAVGFEITVKYKENGELVTRSYKKSVDKVYTSINATENGDIKNVTAKELGALYLYAVVLEGVPTNAGQIDVTVKSFKTVYGGMLDVQGSQMTVSILDGVVNNALSPLS